MDEVNELNPISLSLGKNHIDAMDGMASEASYNPLPDFNGITEVYSHRKTNIDVLGATKKCFDRMLTIFYINV